jgi:hypothetical protein
MQRIQAKKDLDRQNFEHGIANRIFDGLAQFL